MNAREQYEEFKDWLTAKWREIDREWYSATNEEVVNLYDKLLGDIAVELAWADVNADKLK